MDEVKKEEVKKNEKKPLGIRGDDVLAADFKSFAKSLGVPQDVALRELLKLADIDKMRQRVPVRAGDIDDFRTLLDQLLTKFLSSVDAAALAKTQAEEEVKVELNTKTRTISDLQKKQDELHERIEKLEQALESATTENNRLQVEVNKLNETIADKDVLIQSLQNNAVAVDAVEAFAELKELVANLKMKKEPEPVKQGKK